MKIELDKDEKRIFDLLWDGDALPIDKIAEKLNTQSKKIHAKIKSLVAVGILKVENADADIKRYEPTQTGIDFTLDKKDNFIIPVPEAKKRATEKYLVECAQEEDRAA